MINLLLWLLAISHSVIVTWEPSTSYDGTGVQHVWRANSSCYYDADAGEPAPMFVQIDQIDAASNMWVDLDVQLGSHYCYGISYQMRGGSESATDDPAEWADAEIVPFAPTNLQPVVVSQRRKERVLGQVR